MFAYWVLFVCFFFLDFKIMKSSVWLFKNVILLKYSWFIMYSFLLCSQVIQFYLYIDFFFCIFFHYAFIIGYWIWSPVLCNRTLLFIHFIYNGLHLLIPNSQSTAFLPLPSPWQPLECSLCPWVYFSFIGKLICVMF